MAGFQVLKSEFDKFQQASKINLASIHANPASIHPTLTSIHRSPGSIQYAGSPGYFNNSYYPKLNDSFLCASLQGN
jgi:hypothetical protein